ncbi:MULTISPECIES: hypothetical protein [Chroococcidiopsis]|uniref:Uncharacterized protein n=1 Tax=Chroococcidiopsis thermalis (strain PCC 7203) TaxID=251229 RepID=K9U1T5_CHRTP|nr:MULTISPECIES: hypothetical protein [Chroococcidiopsis]AFY88765.1 hypothetical protein Chro_3305 [Chroococcidiopsis thermalis PCC 7203]MBD2306707.1 hypothetical protein [Chroococcidiopsis sp. [FACHB-1243]]
MATLTATAIDRQSLDCNYDTSSLTESIFKILDDMEFDLESIFFQEFAQGLPNDLETAH